MSRRNEKQFIPNAFQRIKLNIQNKRLKSKIQRIKKAHNIDITKTDNINVKETFKNKKELKEYFKDVSKVVGRKNFRFKKLKQGISVKEEKYTQLKQIVEKINLDYDTRKQKIIKNAKENLTEEVANAIERDIEQVDNKKRTRLSTGTFDDLSSLDFQKIIDRVNTPDDLEKIIERMSDTVFYNLEERDKMYRKNYIKAILNTHGINTQTEELIKIINAVDIDKFILGLYNPYSNTEIADFYDPQNQSEYIDYLIEYYKRLI